MTDRDSQHITVAENDRRMKVSVEKAGIGAGLADALRAKANDLMEIDDD